MTRATRRLLPLLLLALLLPLLGGCGYNRIQSEDEAVKGQWSEVLNQYQRRADLIPNLVATVKGEAGFEQDRVGIVHVRLSSGVFVPA
jgi:LemA protein